MDPDWLADRISPALIAEWAAYERHYGPVLVHERIDWGFAALRTVMSGGGRIADNLPPWHGESDEHDEDALMSRLRSLAAKSKPKEG